MVFIAFIYLRGGSFLDDLAFMILATPIFFPAVVKLGFDPLWFGMLIAITVMIGMVIPPQEAAGSPVPAPDRDPKRRANRHPDL